MNIYKITERAQYTNQPHVVAESYSEAEIKYKQSSPYITIENIELVSNNVLL